MAVHQNFKKRPFTKIISRQNVLIPVKIEEKQLTFNKKNYLSLFVLGLSLKTFKSIFLFFPFLCLPKFIKMTVRQNKFPPKFIKMEYFGLKNIPIVDKNNFLLCIFKFSIK